MDRNLFKRNERRRDLRANGRGALSAFSPPGRSPLSFLRRAFGASRRLLPFACAASLLLSSSFTVAGKTEKGLKASEARDLIVKLPGMELQKSAVKVREVTSSSAGTAEATAEVRTAVRFREGKDALAGKLIPSEVRVGDRQWEEIDLVLSAWKAERGAGLLADLEALATDLAARARAKKGETEKQEEPTDKKASKAEKKEASEGGGELRRGAFVVKDFSALLSSSTVEAVIEASFRFNRDAANKWRVAEVRFGDGAWHDVGAAFAALNAEKQQRARAEMETIREALEAFRRERGFYVVAEDHTILVDHLSPRYLTRVLRIDPWHRPYRYRGTRDAYTLTSDGADGQEGTTDDVAVGSRS